MAIILLISLLIFILVFFYWKIIPVTKRGLFLLICSFSLISMFNIIYATFFLLMILVIYRLATLIDENKKLKKRILGITLFLLIGNLLIHKYFLNWDLKMPLSFLDNSARIFWPLGISYITFRLIHYMIEAYRNNIPKSSFVDFALYVFFFPTFLAGPLERFQRFQSQTIKIKSLDIADVNCGLIRVICGIIKKSLIADNLAKLIMPVLYAPQAHARPVVILCIYGLSIQIYMDFASYTDMAIGIARLFGYEIMENFNHPFFQKNVALFWRNWHISLYSWIKDYFFFPLFGYRASNIKIFFGIFCSMMLFMLWHKIRLNFLVLGVYHGLGLVIWYVFQEIKRSFPLFRRFFSRQQLDPVSIFFTFSFISFGFVIFSFNIQNVNNILHKIFW